MTLDKGGINMPAKRKKAKKRTAKRKTAKRRRR
jgi:hypothetical protein